MFLSMNSCHPNTLFIHIGTSQEGHCNFPTNSKANSGVLLHLIVAVGSIN